MGDFAEAFERALEAISVLENEAPDLRARALPSYFGQLVQFARATRWGRLPLSRPAAERFAEQAAA